MLEYVRGFCISQQLHCAGLDDPIPDCDCVYYCTFVLYAFSTGSPQTECAEIIHTICDR